MNRIRARFVYSTRPKANLNTAEKKLFYVLSKKISNIRNWCHTFWSWSCCLLKCFHGVTCSIVASIVWTAWPTAACVSSRLGWVTVLGIASSTSTISSAIWWILDASDSARDLTKWLTCCRRRRNDSSDLRVPVSNIRQITASATEVNIGWGQVPLSEKS